MNIIRTDKGESKNNINIIMLKPGDIVSSSYANGLNISFFIISVSYPIGKSCEDGEEYYSAVNLSTGEAIIKEKGLIKFCNKINKALLNLKKVTSEIQIVSDK
ncbi:hypothetical protein OZX58_03245 [Lactobacillus sp. ESL0680]|uniref:hypothetical protein n=1 Tax=Lactobacillus sp. ESL0680 TaxID=2983210 RepID=UPI0023F95A6A|nr:hypothetical protein [Lactobacillus sp. ESL0680]WEV39266.1 hypothetical protein OZX58_03245 [Lactobacillus sp. ESL0680]